jgi:antitoxin (DNA-binding transcriptional repressor) of toxin-antitoxin stability system
MRSVNILELESQLNTYVTYAKEGEEVIIRDHDKPVAKLVPFASGAFSEDELELAAAGLLRLPTEPWDVEEILRMPEAHLSPGGSGVKALLEEREEGW